MLIPASRGHATFPSNPNLCLHCLKEYENRTLPFVVVDPARPNRLFLSHTRPHKPITSETLGRSDKEILARAGVDTNVFKAHPVGGGGGISYSFIWPTGRQTVCLNYFNISHLTISGAARYLVSTPYLLSIPNVNRKTRNENSQHILENIGLTHNPL